MMKFKSHLRLKSKNLLFYVMIALAGALQSCNIATTVHFNKNYSGTYKMVLDMSDLIGFAGMADTTGAMDQTQMVKEMRYKIDSIGLTDMYNGLSGIRDAFSEVSDEGVISIGFKFDNVESLNASFKSVKEQATKKMGDIDESMEMMPTDFLGGGDQMFKRDGKTITHTFSSEGLGLGGEEDSGDMDMLSSMIDYTVDFSFDRKVKSVDMKGLTLIEKTSNMVRTRVDFSNLIKEGNYAITVKTK